MVSRAVRFHYMLILTRCNSWTTKSDFAYLHYIYSYQISSIQYYLNLNIPIYKKQQKLIHIFILYTRNFLHKTKWEADTTSWGVSI